MAQDEKQTNEQSRDDRLADVIEQYLTASESGSSPSRTALLEQHPDLAEDLAACLDTLDFIGHSLGAGPATAVLECGQQFGEYQILRELGRGGMGVVYEAYHLGLERRVALKVLSGKGFEDAQQRDRFLKEARTAAGLHHTNIVPIFEVGELDGVCYYAMQYISGESLGSIVRRLAGQSRASARQDTTIFPPGTIVRDERPVANERPRVVPKDATMVRTASALADGPVSDRYFREVSRIVAQAADAIAHAHAHGVVHRDVKPSNFILDREGRVWVTDFGLAFRSDDPQQKEARQAVGTPAYMSPEQVRTGTFPVDHRTDIYSLGATLYELLTLRPIFEGDTSLAVLTQIASVNPVAPCAHNARIPKDLDCIVRRAIAKVPSDRYSDAATMAADLRNYLNYEPVGARQLGPLGRLLLWCRREPRLATVTAAAASLLILLSVISHWAILRARNVAVRARDEAERQLSLTAQAEAQARENYRVSLFQQARATSLSFQNGRRWATLDLIRQAQSIRYDDSLRDDAINALSMPDARLINRLVLDKTVERLALCPTRHLVAFSCGDGSVRLWDFDSDSTRSEAVTQLAASGFENETVVFSGCGRFLAGVESDGTIVVWDTTSKNAIVRLETEEFRPRFVAFAGGQTMLIALNGEGTCRRWEISETGARALEPIETARWSAATLGPDVDSITLITQAREVRTYLPVLLFAVHVNVSLFLPPGEVHVWNVNTGAQHIVPDISLGRTRPVTLVWDADGRHLAVGQRTDTVDLWAVGHSQPRSLGGHHGTIRAVAFHPYADLVATSGSRDPAVKLWDATTGDLIALLHEPLAGSLTASFSSDGQYLAAGGNDKTIWLWEVVAPKSFRRWAAHEDVVTQVAISPDGTLIASGSADGSVALSRSEGQETPVVLAPRVHDRETRFRTHACAGLFFSPDGRLLAARLRNGSIQVWNTASHELVARLDSEQNMRSGGAAFLPNSQEIIRLSNRAIERWSIDSDSDPTTVATATAPLSAMALSPDGLSVSVCTSNGIVQFYDLSSGKMREPTVELPAQGLSMAIDQTGERLAVGDRGGTIHLIDTRSMAVISKWKESDDELTSVSFSSDGRWLGITGQDGIVRLRGMPDGQLVASFAKHDGGSRSLAFGPHSFRLATCGDDKLVHVWRLDSLNSELAGFGLAW
jgi:eukaryotic-like serine/threonine-protein kinase